MAKKQIGWFWYLLGCVVIVLAVLAGNAIWNLLHGESATFESYDDNKYVINFSTTNSVFSSTTEDDVYQYATTLEPVEFDATVKDYEVLFNQAPCNATIDHGQISAKYKVKLLNADGSVKLADTLFIKVEFLTQGVNITITIKSGSASASQLNRFLNNGFNLKIIEIGEKDNGKTN